MSVPKNTWLAPHPLGYPVLKNVYKLADWWGGGNPYVHVAPGYLKSFGLGLILYLAARPIMLSRDWCENLQRNNNVLKCTKYMSLSHSVGPQLNNMFAFSMNGKHLTVKMLYIILHSNLVILQQVNPRGALQNSLSKYFGWRKNTSFS